MAKPYGDIRGSRGADGDAVDVFLSSDIDSWDGRRVYVVDQYRPDGGFDEHKVMLGFNSAEDAMKAYLANYERGWESTRRLDIAEASVEGFRDWISSPGQKKEAFAKDRQRTVSQQKTKFDRTIPVDNAAQRIAVARIVSIANKIKNRVERAVIRGITGRQKRDFALQGIQGIDDTWVHSFESSAVSHNQKHHGNAKSEEKRGQLAITPGDYVRIPEILEHYDKVTKSPNKTNGTENEVIIYEKDMEDGYVYYLEEKRDNRKSLAFHTMYKKKKETDSSDGVAVESTAPITPSAPSDNLSSLSEGKVNDSSADSQENSSDTGIRITALSFKIPMNFQK